MTGEVLVGDEGKRDDREENDGGDDNGEDEALLAGTALAMLTEPAISYWADSNDDETCPHPGESLV